MILTILMLVLFFIIVSLVIFFLMEIMVPAVKDQTEIKANILFSHLEHNYSKLTEKENVEPSNKKALIKCFCNKTFSSQSKNIRTGQSCSVINNVYETINDCKYSCIGMGDCIKACNKDAIILKNNCAVITELCNGCGNCVNSCPKNLIEIVESNLKREVLCSNKDAELTSCSNFKKEATIVRPEKKYFKLWKTCYKLFPRK